MAEQIQKFSQTQGPLTQMVFTAPEIDYSVNYCFQGQASTVSPLMKQRERDLEDCWRSQPPLLSFRGSAFIFLKLLSQSNGII